MFFKSKEAKIKVTLFLFVFLIYLLTAGGHFYSWDTNTKYEVTKSIVDRGRLDIDSSSDQLVDVREREGLREKS